MLLLKGKGWKDDTMPEIFLRNFLCNIITIFLLRKGDWWVWPLVSWLSYRIREGKTRDHDEENPASPLSLCREFSAIASLQQAGRYSVHPRTKATSGLKGLAKYQEDSECLQMSLFFPSTLSPFVQRIPFWTFFVCYGPLSSYWRQSDANRTGGVVVLHACWVAVSSVGPAQNSLSNSVLEHICSWCVVNVLPFSDHTESIAALQVERVDFTTRDALW